MAGGGQATEAFGSSGVGLVRKAIQFVARFESASAQSLWREGPPPSADPSHGAESS